MRFHILRWTIIRRGHLSIFPQDKIFGKSYCNLSQAFEICFKHRIRTHREPVWRPLHNTFDVLITIPKHKMNHWRHHLRQPDTRNILNLKSFGEDSRHVGVRLGSSWHRPLFASFSCSVKQSQGYVSEYQHTWLSSPHIS